MRIAKKTALAVAVAAALVGFAPAAAATTPSVNQDSVSWVSARIQQDPDPDDDGSEGDSGLLGGVLKLVNDLLGGGSS